MSTGLDMDREAKRPSLDPELSERSSLFTWELEKCSESVAQKVCTGFVSYPKLLYRVVEI